MAPDWATDVWCSLRRCGPLGRTAAGGREVLSMPGGLQWNYFMYSTWVLPGTKTKNLGFILSTQEWGKKVLLERCTTISTGQIPLQDLPVASCLCKQTNSELIYIRASNKLCLWSLHVPNTVWEVWQDESDSICSDLTLGLRSTEPARHHTCPNHTDTNWSHLVSHRAPPPILPWASKSRKLVGLR